MLLIANHFCVALAISFNEYFSFQEAIFYLSGVSVAGFIGVLCLAKLRKYEKNISLNRFYGLSYEHPKLALLFLLVCLALMGFPITTTFIGEDLIFSHIHHDQFILAYFTASSFIFSGLSVVRMYARLFLGPHMKSYHEIPYKSA